MKKVFYRLIVGCRFMWRKKRYHNNGCEWRSMFGGMWYNNRDVGFREMINDFKKLG